MFETTDTFTDAPAHIAVRIKGQLGDPITKNLTGWQIGNLLEVDERFGTAPADDIDLPGAVWRIPRGTGGNYAHALLLPEEGEPLLAARPGHGWNYDDTETANAPVEFKTQLDIQADMAAGIRTAYGYIEKLVETRRVDRVILVANLLNFRPGETAAIIAYLRAKGITVMVVEAGNEGFMKAYRDDFRRRNTSGASHSSATNSPRISGRAPRRSRIRSRAMPTGPTISRIGMTRFARSFAPAISSRFTTISSRASLSSALKGSGRTQRISPCSTGWFAISRSRRFPIGSLGLGRSPGKGRPESAAP